MTGSAADLPYGFERWLYDYSARVSFSDLWKNARMQKVVQDKH